VGRPYGLYVHGDSDTTGAVRLVEDRTRARHRLSKFLLRHGRVWRGGATAWTVAHER
jgi:hypothetical protein